MTNRLSIREVIVVEGRDDEANIKRFIDAQIIITHGFGINKSTLSRIRHAAETVGIIILTDPDFAGEKIRQKLSEQVSGTVKQAYISRAEGTKNGNIGVENASKQAIISAITAAKPVSECLEWVYSTQDMYALGLAGHPAAKARRIAVGKAFRIGYGNAKQLCARLNKFKIERSELAALLEALDSKG